mgnify:CR=1 FL=1
MIEAIDVSLVDDTKYLNQFNNKLMNLKNIKKINIFIGENNSGKSRMLRSFLKNDNVFIYSKKYIDDSKIRNLKDHFISLNTYVSSFNNYSNNFKINIPKEYHDMNFIDRYININDYIRSLNINTNELSNSNARSNYSNINGTLDSIRSLLKKPISDSYKQNQKMNELDITYIPILRGIECFNNYYDINKSTILDSVVMNESQRQAMNEYKMNSKKIYKNKVIKAYDIKKSNSIFTAENLYDEITAKLLGEESDRNFVSDFQKFISEQFYDGKEFSIIPKQSKGYLSVKIGNESDKALHNLGDGIKQLITLLYKIYEKKDKEAIFLIEEPEINLHPGYQRKFIEILQLSMFSKHQYFITTHSNHLIDSCFDYNCISIYKFINFENKNNTFKVVNSSPNDVETLQLLGVNNSSVFIANCTIWVEGISDKILISKYLQIYFKENDILNYYEDIHYSFVEYGGNNITHWSFIPTSDIETINASGITNKSFIICDNDNDSKSKKKRKDILKAIFKDNYCELAVREIENTISKEVLEKTLFNGEPPEYKISYETNREYATKSARMGDFIDTHYILKRKYGTKDTGTILNKFDFSKRIANNINNINDLSPQAKNICKKIYEFIKKSNN